MRRYRQRGGKPFDGPASPLGLRGARQMALAGVSGAFAENAATVSGSCTSRRSSARSRQR